MSIILASTSTFRAALLKNAGLNFTTITSDIDERAIEESMLESQMLPADISEILAIAKAEQVSADNRNNLVIGCDQTLSFKGEMIHKPKDMEEARRRLLAFSGNSHTLSSAIALAKNGKVVWSHVEPCNITFRTLSPEFIGHHLAQVGNKVLSSVGAYQIEAEGIQLFEKIEGDYFSIMGLPLLPLLKQLRQLNILES